MDILKAMQRAGASRVQLDRLASLWTKEWPEIAVGDLHIPPEGEADFYVDTVETFIRDHLSGYRHLFAIENDAVHVSVNVPVRFAHAVRDAAVHRRVTPNELVFTPVSHELEMASASAA